MKFVLDVALIAALMIACASAGMVPSEARQALPSHESSVLSSISRLVRASARIAKWYAWEDDDAGPVLRIPNLKKSRGEGLSIRSAPRSAREVFGRSHVLSHHLNSTCGYGVANETTLEYFCNGTKVNETEADGSDNCTTNAIVESCICPVDYEGKYCSKKKPFACTVTLLAPAKQCEALSWTSAPRLTGDPKCLVFSQADSPSFSYGVDCAFDDYDEPVFTTDAETGAVISPPVPEKSAAQLEVEAQGFTYWTKQEDEYGVKFASSADPSLDVVARLVNFNVLSDRSTEVRIALTAQHISGSATADFTLLLGGVAEAFYSGGRLYLEAGLPDERGLTVTFSREFLDVRERDVELVERKKAQTTTITVAVSIVVLILVVGGCCLGSKLKSRKSNPNKEKKN